MAKITPKNRIILPGNFFRFYRVFTSSGTQFLVSSISLISGIIQIHSTLIFIIHLPKLTFVFLFFCFLLEPILTLKFGYTRTFLSNSFGVAISFQLSLSDYFNYFVIEVHYLSSLIWALFGSQCSKREPEIHFQC